MLLVLSAEIFIALFAEGILRTFIGDLLIVIFLYTLVRSFLKIPSFKTAMAILFLAYATELMQYFRVLDYFNLSDSENLVLLMGHRFDWWDILAYSLGIWIVLGIEYLLEKKGKLSF